MWAFCSLWYPPLPKAALVAGPDSVTASEAPVMSCSPRYLPHRSRRSMEREKASLPLLGDPRSFSKVLWSLYSQALHYGPISREKKRSQRELCPHHTAQPQAMWPLDMGAQHVWSPMPCYVRVIRITGGPSRVWESGWIGRRNPAPFQFFAGCMRLLLQEKSALPSSLWCPCKGKCHKWGKT